MPALARSRPFQELEELRQRRDRVSEETRGGGDGWTLAIDLQEQADKYVLRADVPGMKPAGGRHRLNIDRVIRVGELGADANVEPATARRRPRLPQPARSRRPAGSGAGDGV
jgi:HSP20 family protein